jgi:hypothetical protein
VADDGLTNFSDGFFAIEIPNEKNRAFKCFTQYRQNSTSPALPLVRSLIFQTIPPGPQIDHRRLYASVLARSSRGCCRDYHSHAPESGDGFTRNCRLIILAIVMSALPPRADMCSATRDVRFGPKADIARVIISACVSP